MNLRKWLIISENKSARITQGKPALRLNEVSILLDIDIPNELFRKPRLEAKIEIPNEAAMPETINAGVIENVQEAIKSVTGLDLKIRVIKEDGPEEEETKNEHP